MAVTPIRITEKKTDRINRKCPENPVYLKWWNLRGGIDYWLFSITQTESLKVGGDQIFEKDIIDLENADGVKEFLTKDARESLRIGDDNLDENDIDGIKGLLFAPKVQVLVSQNPLVWQTVLVNTGTFKIKETGESRFRIELTIEKPDLIIQTQ